METMSLSDAKARLSELVTSVEQTHERVTVTKNGRNAVVIIAVEDLEALQETLELLQDASAMGSIRASEREVDAGVEGDSVQDLRLALRAEATRKNDEAADQAVAATFNG